MANHVYMDGHQVPVGWNGREGVIWQVPDASFPKFYLDRYISGQIKATDFPQIVVNSKGNPPKNQGNLGWWNMIIWPDIYLWFTAFCGYLV